jgi:hypothetical protein
VAGSCEQNNEAACSISGTEFRAVSVCFYIGQNK